MALRFFNASLEESVQQIARSNFRQQAILVTTPNINHVVRLKKSSDLRTLYQKSSFVFCDGEWVRKLINLNTRASVIQQRITGVDLVNALLTAKDESYDVFVVGANQSIIESLTCAESISANFVGQNPALRETLENEDFCAHLLDQVKESNANLILLCIGSPQQEELWLRVFSQHPGIYICAGASLELISGFRKRAPLILQQLGLEWFYRWVQEPRRLFSRYFTDGLYMSKLFIDAARGKL